MSQKGSFVGPLFPRSSVRSQGQQADPACIENPPAHTLALSKTVVLGHTCLSYKGPLLAVSRYRSINADRDTTDALCAGHADDQFD
jgi:hypothetical protein